MKFRYDDSGREFTRKELDQQDFVDSSIMELINKVNPTENIISYSGKIVSKIREALIEVYTKDLKICTERKFYP
jgi:hypothetical protein